MTNIFKFLEEKRSVFLTEKQNPIVLKKKIEYIAKNNIDLKFNPDFYLDNTIHDFLKKINTLKSC